MYRDNTKRKSNIASIVELFMMFLLLLVVIVVITMVCMTTREQSLHAHYLTEAVICAENTAEVTHTSKNAEQAAEMIAQMDGASDVSVDGDMIKAKIDDYELEITLTPQKDAVGTYVSEDISVYHGGKTAIYELHTGSFNK